MSPESHRDDATAQHDAADPRANRSADAPTDDTDLTDVSITDRNPTGGSVDATQPLPGEGAPVSARDHAGINTATGTSRTASWPIGGRADVIGASSARVAGPRVRVGAIVWGVIVTAFAVLVIAITSSAGARSAFQAWQASLTAGSWAVIGVVTLGVIVVLIAGVSVIRGAQRRAAERARG